MIIRRRVLKTIVLAIILISIISTWYINKFLAPTILKNLLLENISQVLDRPVSLKSVRFSLLRGFILNDLIIYEPDGKTTFIKIERVTTSILFIPLIGEKKIIIPSVSIASPLVNAVKKQDNTWNFLNPPLLKKVFPLEKPKKKGFTILVQKIRFERGQVNFSDNTRSPAYTKELVNLEGNVTFSQKGIVYFKTAAQLDTPEKTNIGLDGSYALEENLLAIKAVLKNLSLLEPYTYFYKIGLFADLKNGIADTQLDLKIDKDKKLILNTASSVKKLNISYFGLNLKGDLDITGAYDLNLAKPSEANYKIELGLKGPSLGGVYLLNEVSNLTGVIKISNNGIQCNYLGGVACNTPITFSGQIKDFSDPRLEATVSADLDLVNYRNFLPEDLKAKFKETELEGLAEISVNFYDILKDPQPPSVDGNIRLQGISLKTPPFSGKMEKIVGNVAFKNDVYYLSRISFNYGAQDYVLDAKIVGLKSPDIRTKLEGKDLLLSSRFQIQGNNIHILRASGDYLDSSFNIGGDIQNLKEPDVFMKGALALDLIDLRKIFPKISDTLTRFDIKGICNLEFSVNGPWKDPRGLEITIKGTSDKIGVWNFKFNDVMLELKMKDKHLMVPEFSARPYGGAFISTMDMDLTQQNPPYVINVVLEGVDLSKFVLDSDFKNKQMSGKGNAKCSIRGYGKNLDTIKAEGSILIKGGCLWEVPLLMGLADLLFLPNLSNVVFDEASCDFIITNKTISTANLTLHSSKVSILAEGGINFDGAIDFLVTTSISEEFVKDSFELSRLATVFLSEARNLIGNIRITGTIKKPEYKLVPFPIDKILKDKLKGLLGGFF